MRDSRQKLLMPAINLHESRLIVRQRQPLIAPRARADRIRVAPARRRRVKAYQPFDVTFGADTEGADVAGETKRVGARGCEEIFAAVGEEDDIRAIVLQGKAWRCVSNLGVVERVFVPGGTRGYVICVNTGICVCSSIT